MREVFTHQDVTQVGYYKSMLDEAGISSFIRNEYTANPEIAGAMYFPTLCVVDDVDYDKALVLLKSQKLPDQQEGTDWTCPSCSETNPANFESCWKCHSLRPIVSAVSPAQANPPAPKEATSQTPSNTHQPTNPDSSKKVYFLVFLSLAFIGLWCIATTMGDLIEAFQSSSWPTTPGEIVSSRIHLYAAGRSRNTSYLPEITYTYTVAGQNFTGTMISPGHWWSYVSASNVTERFPKGSHRPISYFPSDPSRALLDPGLHPGNFGHFIMGLIFCTLAVPFALLGLSVNHNQKSKSSRATLVKKSPAARYAPLVVALAFLEFCILVWLSRA